MDTFLPTSFTAPHPLLHHCYASAREEPMLQLQCRMVQQPVQDPPPPAFLPLMLLLKSLAPLFLSNVMDRKFDAQSRHIMMVMALIFHQSLVLINTSLQSASHTFAPVLMLQLIPLSPYCFFEWTISAAQLTIYICIVFRFSRFIK
jgi:hypothetical protein